MVAPMPGAEAGVGEATRQMILTIAVVEYGFDCSEGQNGLKWEL